MAPVGPQVGDEGQEGVADGEKGLHEDTTDGTVFWADDFHDEDEGSAVANVAENAE